MRKDVCNDNTLKILLSNWCLELWISLSVWCFTTEVDLRKFLCFWFFLWPKLSHSFTAIHFPICKSFSKCNVFFASQKTNGSIFKKIMCTTQILHYKPCSTSTRFLFKCALQEHESLRINNIRWPHYFWEVGLLDLCVWLPHRLELWKCIIHLWASFFIDISLLGWEWCWVHFLLGSQCGQMPLCELFLGLFSVASDRNVVASVYLLSCNIVWPFSCWQLLLDPFLPQILLESLIKFCLISVFFVKGTGNRWIICFYPVYSSLYL